MSVFIFAKNRILWAAQAKNGASAMAQTVIGRVFVIGLNIVNGVLVSRSLGPAGRGEQAALIIGPQIFPAALTLGIPYAVLFHARASPELRNQIYYVALIAAVILGGASGFIGGFALPIWLRHYSEATIGAGQYLMIFAIFNSLNYFMSSIFESEHDFSKANILRYVPTVLTSIALISLAIAKQISPLTTALAYLAPTAFVVLYFFIPISTFIAQAKSDVTVVTGRLCNYGFRVYGTNLLGLFNLQIDQFLVISFLSAQNLGIYVVCLSASRVVNLFETALSTVVLPKIAGKPPVEASNLIGTLSRLTFFASACFALGLASVLPWLIPHIYGSGFASGVTTTEILLVEAVLSSTTNILLQSYLAVDRPAIVTLFQSAGLLLAVPLMIVLIPRFGLVGAALSLLTSTMARYFSARLGYKYVLGVHVPKFLLSPADIAYLRRSILPHADGV